jgi:PAS domain S-box-containing protein
MKKFVLLILLLVFILSLMIYNLIESNIKIKTNLALNNKIAHISRLNTELLIFTKSHNQSKNYDLVEENIQELKEIYKNLKNEKMYGNILNNHLYKRLIDLKQLINAQIKIIQKQKSYDAIYNNSLKNIQKIKSLINNNRFDNIYNLALTLNFEENIYDEKIKTKLNNIQILSFEEAMLVKHLTIIFEYYLKKHNLIEEIYTLNIQDKLKELINEFEVHSNSLLKSINSTIFIFLIILLMLLGLLGDYSFTLLKNKLELEKMKKALDISDNVILITDKNHKIKYVNKGFERNTGYTKEEVLGKSPSIFSSGKLDTGFYKNLHKTIHEGKEWHGEFVNKNQDGDIVYERSTITPIKDKRGNIIEFLAIKLDITKEKEYQEIFLQQSKMASMGELLENISHQWRQPLSIISSVSSSQKIHLQLDNQIEKEKLIESFDKIFNTTQTLSQTIDNLKEFFNHDDEMTIFNIKESINKSLDLCKMSLDINKVTIIKNNVDGNLIGKEKELIQALLNILNNSTDAFNTNKIDNRYIYINSDISNSIITLKIQDNAGGINESIIDKVFDLYFTTKHKYLGTGIGLYMTYQIITKNFNGSINIENSDLIINDIKQKGTLVTINIPINN